MPTDIIQWFPGHMAKTKRLIKENLASVDIVIELLDARIPYSSANPQLKELIGQKPVITVLNKSSLADEKASVLWREYYISKGRRCIICDCINGGGLGLLKDGISKVLADKLARYEEKGMSGQRTNILQCFGRKIVAINSCIGKCCGTGSGTVVVSIDANTSIADRREINNHDGIAVGIQHRREFITIFLCCVYFI